MPVAQTFASEHLDARAARRLARLLNPAPVFSVHTPECSSRMQVERYIAERFEAVHGARVHDFMPALLTMGCGGRISAATGVRAAAGQRLFLEQYLPDPIEFAVTATAGASVRRTDIAEIGNLVATQGGSSYLLFLVLTAILEQAGFEWVTFTATPQVRKALDWLGIQVHTLCAADPARLTEGCAGDWSGCRGASPRAPQLR